MKVFMCKRVGNYSGGLAVVVTNVEKTMVINENGYSE